MLNGIGELMITNAGNDQQRTGDVSEIPALLQVVSCLGQCMEEHFNSPLEISNELE